MPIRPSDVDPYGFYDAAELNTDSTVVFLTLTVTATISPNTVLVSLAADGEGILTGADHPVHAAANSVSGLGDFADISGTSGGGGDGTFQVATVVSDTEFTVMGVVANSTGGTVNFRYQPGAENVGYSQVHQNITPSNLVQPAITDVSNHELLDNEPVGTNVSYSVTRSGNKVIQETWINTATTKTIKTIAYTYTGNKVTQEVRTVFATDGVTIIAQVTIVYSYVGNSVTGDLTVRNV